MSSAVPPPDPAKDQDYPEQLHAGRAGLGPNYKTGPDLSDKVAGLYEEAKGKLLKKPELVEHGRDRRTGEQNETSTSNPF
ncbi:hypothetical protein AX14_010855 [Amanita brunnescens Koide BX004]|nr:hypothetical protein AX14_010855 [Amanita brunnescens Koide BX004]